MTLSETKAKIRAARALMRSLRAEVNSRFPGQPPDEILLPLADFETLEWGMDYLLKTWIYDAYDAEGEPIRETARLVRMRGLFTKPDGTDNFLFKGIPVRVRKEAA